MTRSAAAAPPSSPGVAWAAIRRVRAHVSALAGWVRATVPPHAVRVREALIVAACGLQIAALVEIGRGRAWARRRLHAVLVRWRLARRGEVLVYVAGVLATLLIGWMAARL